MNMQALMKQAQSLQNEMTKIQQEIEKTTFDGENSIVKVKVNGRKEVLEIKIDKTAKLESEDIEMLEDMILVALNNAFTKVDEYKEKKLSKFGNIPGLI